MSDHTTDNCPGSTNPRKGYPDYLHPAIQDSYPRLPKQPNDDIDWSRSPIICEENWPPKNGRGDYPPWWIPFPKPKQGESGEDYNRRLEPAIKAVERLICRILETFRLPCGNLTIDHFVERILFDPYLYHRWLMILHILEKGRQGRELPGLEGTGLFIPREAQLHDILRLLYQMFGWLKDVPFYGQRLRELWKRGMKQGKDLLEKIRDDADLFVKPFLPEWDPKLPMEIIDPPCEGEPPVLIVPEPETYPLPDIDFVSCEGRYFM